MAVTTGVLREENFERRRKGQILSAFFNYVVGRLKQLNLNMQTQSVCVGVDAQLLYSVINKCIVRGGVKPCEVVVD